MLLNEILQIVDLCDKPGKIGKSVLDLFQSFEDIEVTLKDVKSSSGETQFIQIVIPGNRTKNLHLPTLGIIGRLGGLGARPERVGLVSDSDGALTALSVALKLCNMRKNGDILAGNVIVATHLCTNAPIVPHKPVPFMGSPVSLETMNKFEVSNKMNAILSIDTSRGNNIINTNGFAISPTVKEGWILKVSSDLLRLMEYTTGKHPHVVPLSMQDITPYGNGVDHFNSILQPATATKSPVVGIALTSEIAIPGSATGVSNPFQIDTAGRFIIEVAQEFTKNNCSFFDKKEFLLLKKLYGSMEKLQKNPLHQKGKNHEKTSFNK